MDPQPKALRPYVLLSTAFVLFGAVAGYAVFLQQRAGSRAQAPDADDAAIDAVRLRPLSPPASVDAATRERIAESVRILTSDPSGPARRAAGEALLALGPVAVPSLLDALQRVATSPPGFDDAESRTRLLASDTALSRIRLAATPGSPADPYRRAPDAAWCVRRVKSWFLWWDAYVEAHPEAR